MSHYNEDISNNAGIILELFRLFISQRLQIETHAGEIVFGLSDVHPETLELHGVELRVVAHVREYFFFDRHVSQLENHGIESIKHV